MVSGLPGRYSRFFVGLSTSGFDISRFATKGYQGCVGQSGITQTPSARS